MKSINSVVQDVTGKKVGAVLVIGAGISGMQSALDLAEAGFKVYLVEKSSGIAGTMPQLDKTFPTNDCSMCILSPKVVEAGGHINIEVMTLSELVDLQGEPGNFQARVKKYPRYVDPELCVSCGRCESVCPVTVKNEFNEGLDERKAIYKLFAQAYPNSYIIDKENCIECGECEEKCARNAIDHNMQEEEFELEVGAVILSPGFEIIDASLRGEFGYGVHDNVITSLQFERLLSASGPHQGHPVRPSDGEEPKKIAFIQCVGSREPESGRDYCSGVCCMYAAKEAIVAKEHLPGLDVSIFNIDVRAFGKDFEQYYERAKNSYGVRYEKCMVSSVKELQQTKNLLVKYRTSNGELVEEEFDMVVLSVGIKPASGTEEMAEAAGISLDEFGFCKQEESCVTSRPGVYTAGTFAGPKDIPETVSEASAAAGYASRLLGDVRNTCTESETYVPERDISGEEPRVGVFVCNCGINIGSVIEVSEVVNYAKTLKNVAYAGEFMFACAGDSLDKIKKRIKSQKLNRVVVASCTPRTHAPLFQEALRESGLNPYLYEHVNIREHSSWVHKDYGEEATKKACDLVRMAVSKARYLEPVTPTYTDITRMALVVGGGSSGMSASLSLAEQGFQVYLVEKSAELGGWLNKIHYSIDGRDLFALAGDLKEKVLNNSNIEVYTESRIVETGGYTGNYRTVINTPGGEKEIVHGCVIMATGAGEIKPEEYSYGEDSRVITQTEFESRLDGEDLTGVNDIVMIQCVGSRNEKRPYCSRVCCTQAVKNALRVKKMYPHVNVYVLYRDIRVYGTNEKYYTEARRRGVIFIPYEPGEEPEVNPGEAGVEVSVRDRVLDCTVKINPQLLVLSAGVAPNEDNDELAQLFKFSLNNDGYMLEAHMKLRPVDFAADGLYLCGLAHSPKLAGESISQANAAAMRAVTLLSRDKLQNVGITVYVDEEVCTGCGLCVKACSYGARYIDKTSGTAKVVDVLCQGCGACVVACPSGATRQKGFDMEQMMAMVKSAIL